MNNAQRISQQPGFVLHRRPFRDSSQILDLLTRDHGRVAVVSRGSRAARSRLAGVLRPFLPLRVSWTARSDLGTLTGAEADGAPLGLRGDALLSAYYLNELCLNFLHRLDPQPEIFQLYRRATVALNESTAIAANLRAFEIEFLGLLGYALNLSQEAGGDAIRGDSQYEYRVEQGAVRVGRSTGRMVFSGNELLAIAAQSFESDQVLNAANRLLRTVIDWHLGGRELNSRKVLRAMHRGRIAASDGDDSRS